MANGGRIGRRNVPVIDGASGIWSLQEIADAARLGLRFNRDFFDSDTSAQYTQYADTAGTWAISGGELVATNGAQAVFIRNGTSYTDVAIEADMSHAYDGGLVLRFIDTSNYYLAALSDDSGIAPTQNIRIFKRVSGTFTQLGSNVDITWTRGVSKTIRFQASGTTIQVFVDGVSQLSVTDSAIAGPGGVGMRNSTSGQQSKFQAFRWGI